jgi:hypothetical protein
MSTGGIGGPTKLLRVILHRSVQITFDGGWAYHNTNMGRIPFVKTCCDASYFIYVVWAD